MVREIAAQYYKNDQPPDRSLAVRTGAYQLRDVPNWSGLSLDLSPTGDHTCAFRLERGCQACDAMSFELVSVALILTQHTDDLVDESPTDVF
jgi:hypothetical protein